MNAQGYSVLLQKIIYKESYCLAMCFVNINNSMGNIVAIVGRPNVGKSTLFNRLIQKREAIIDSVSGVTRDRHYGKSDWNGKEFSVIDTGGYVVGSDDVFEAEIDKQVELAIDEADAIIFMVDVESGITGMDEEVANLNRDLQVALRK